MTTGNAKYKFIGIYTLTYGAMGAVLPLLGQYLAGIGFSGTQIGSITAAGTMAAVFANAFWGGIYNGSSRKHELVALLCLASGVMMAVLPQIRLYILVLASYAVLYFFQQPINALSDALTIEQGQPFNFIRMWGAVGYASFVFVAGKVAESMEISLIFYIAAVCFTLSAVIVMSVRRGARLQAAESESGAGGGKRGALRELAGNGKYLKLLICVFFIGGTNIANNTYFSFLYTDAGGDLAGVGLAFMLMAGSEAPFMTWSARITERFTLEKTILAALLVSVCRFLLYSTSPSCQVLLGTFFLQGIVNGILLVELVKYVNKTVQGANLGLAISIYYIVSSSLSAVACQMIGGVILDYFSAGGVYLFFAAFNMIGAILYVLLGLNKN